MERFVVDIFSAIIEYFAVYAFLWMFFEKHPNRKKWRLGCHVIMPLIFLTLSMSIHNIYLKPVLFIACACLIATGFQGYRGHKFFSVSVFQVILILFEVTISLLLHPIAGLSAENFYLYGNIIIRFATLGILLLLFILSKKWSVFFKKLSIKQVLMLLAFSGVSLFIMLFSQYLLIMLDRSELYTLGCIGALLCIFSNIGLYYLFYQLANGEEAKARLRFLDFHLSQQEEKQSYQEQTYHEIRKLSHDMKHILSVLLSMLENQQYEQMKDELQRRLGEVGGNSLTDTGYPVLDSVLAYKFQEAQNKHIRTQLFWNIQEPLQLHVTDLAIILSNGLDNAIEAASQVTDDEPFLSLSAEMKGTYIRIRICNNTKVAPTIVNDTIATTKQDKHLHGLGLESIKALCQRYHGQAFLDCENYLFTLTVILENTACVAEVK